MMPAADLAARVDAIEPIARRALDLAERIEAELPARVAEALRAANVEQLAAVRDQLADAERLRNAAAAERREKYEAEAARREWWLRALIAVGPPVYAAVHAVISEFVHR